MKLVRRLVVTASVFALLATSVHADVIPSTYKNESESRTKVEAKFTEMGLKSQTAHLRAQGMTDEEAAYFADDVQRIQVSGQEIWAGQTDMLWYEWIGGLAALGGTVALIFFMANEA